MNGDSGAAQGSPQHRRLLGNGVCQEDGHSTAPGTWLGWFCRGAGDRSTSGGGLVRLRQGERSRVFIRESVKWGMLRNVSPGIAAAPFQSSQVGERSSGGRREAHGV